MMTPLDLCNQAAISAGIIAHDEQLTGSEAKDAMSQLNRMLSSYSMESLIANSGLTFPLASTDVHTGMDDQLEYALVDLLAVRLASVYKLPVPEAVYLAGRRAEQNIQRMNSKPLWHEPDLVLTGLSR